MKNGCIFSLVLLLFMAPSSFGRPEPTEELVYSSRGISFWAETPIKGSTWARVFAKEESAFSNLVYQLNGILPGTEAKIEFGYVGDKATSIISSSLLNRRFQLRVTFADGESLFFGQSLQRRFRLGSAFQAQVFLFWGYEYTTAESIVKLLKGLLPHVFAIKKYGFLKSPEIFSERLQLLTSLLQGSSEFLNTAESRRLLDLSAALQQLNLPPVPVADDRRRSGAVGKFVSGVVQIATQPMIRGLPNAMENWMSDAVLKTLEIMPVIEKTDDRLGAHILGRLQDADVDNVLGIRFADPASRAMAARVRDDFLVSRFAAVGEAIHRQYGDKVYLQVELRTNEVMPAAHTDLGVISGILNLQVTVNAIRDGKAIATYQGQLPVTTSRNGFSALDDEGAPDWKGDLIQLLDSAGENGAYDLLAISSAPVCGRLLNEGGE